jgi:hypothetical protein
MMKFSMHYTISSCRVLLFVAVFGANRSFALHQNGTSSTILPARQFVNNAVAALGGEHALANIRSVVYQAPVYVAHVFIIVAV